jgi:4-amino-4-deoxy-L-arabinose transferase-like glycosyltransferase
VAALFIAGAITLCAANLAPPATKRWLAICGYSGLIAAMFFAPAIWSVLTNQHASDNQSLPAAYVGRANGPGRSGRIQVDQALLDFLQANTQNTYYLMAVPSSMQGADYILATGRPVLYMGGFNGQDQVLTSESLARLVESGQLRYIYWNAGNARGLGGGQLGGQTAITSWISSQCQAVTGFNTTTRDYGAPGGISTAPGAGNQRSGDMQVALYDCAPG